MLKRLRDPSAIALRMTPPISSCLRIFALKKLTTQKLRRLGRLLGGFEHQGANGAFFLGAAQTMTQAAIPEQA